MDRELLLVLGLDPEKNRKDLLEDLEGKQYEFFERLETTNDENRREELNGLLSRIDEAIGSIKDELAAMDSAIILDTAAANGVNAVDQQTEQELQKAKEAELAVRVQAIKEKEQSRREETARAEQEAASEQTVQPDPAPVTAAVQQGDSALQQGLLRYHKQDYAGAFPIFKKLAEENNATAQYMLACMYKRGEGADANPERAEFWMQKAADNGDAVAQFDYAVILLSDSGRDDSKTRRGVRYLDASAKQGNRDAMVRYVELVVGGIGNMNEIKTARTYCAELLPCVEDSYDKQHFEMVEKQLRGKQKATARRNFGTAASTVVSIMGALILMAATILIFAGYHQEFLRTVPVIKQWPSEVLDKLFGFWYVGNTIQDVLAAKIVLILVAVGWMFKGAGNKYRRNKLATVIVRIGVALRFLVIGGHIAICVVTGTDVMNNIWLNLGAVAVAIIAGRLVGLIFGKILSTNY